MLLLDGNCYTEILFIQINADDYYLSFNLCSSIITSDRGPTLMLGADLGADWDVAPSHPFFNKLRRKEKSAQIPPPPDCIPLPFTRPIIAPLAIQYVLIEAFRCK